MPLTVREKEHWKERIARRIDHAIEEIQASDDPGFRQRIRDQAEEQAWSSLGLTALRNEENEIQAELKRLSERRDVIRREMGALINGHPPGESRNHCRSVFDVRSAVFLRAKVHERQLLKESELGQRILHLLHEKEELLDTVWLATSPSQIKDLWSRCADALDWEPPRLQQHALKIPAVSDDS